MLRLLICVIHVYSEAIKWFDVLRVNSEWFMVSGIMLRLEMILCVLVTGVTVTQARAIRTPQKSPRHDNSQHGEGTQLTHELTHTHRVNPHTNTHMRAQDESTHTHTYTHTLSHALTTRAHLHRLHPSVQTHIHTNTAWLTGVVLLHLRFWRLRSYRAGGHL